MENFRWCPCAKSIWLLDIRMLSNWWFPLLGNHCILLHFNMHTFEREEKKSLKINNSCQVLPALTWKVPEHENDTENVPSRWKVLLLDSLVTHYNICGQTSTLTALFHINNLTDLHRIIDDSCQDCWFHSITITTKLCSLAQNYFGHNPAQTEHFQVSLTTVGKWSKFL